MKQSTPKKGKGLFAKTDIKKNTIFEVAHVILLSNDDYEKIKDTTLYHYSFTWDDPTLPDYMNAIAMSICQFINHSYEPNVQYFYNYDNQTIEYSTLKDIKRGEELLVNYNGIPDDKESVWFDVE